LKGSSNRNKRETRTPGTGGSGGVLHRAEMREIEVAFGARFTASPAGAKKFTFACVSSSSPPLFFSLVGLPEVTKRIDGVA